MRRLLATLLTLALLSSAAAPASAADEIGLSRDGKHWSDALTEPLFDQDTLWVPGDSRTVSFYVRNQAGTDASLTATVRSSDRDDLMADEHVDLRARAGGQWFTLRNGKPSQELNEVSIRPGAPVKVEVEAAFDPNSSNASQSRSLRLMFDIRLTDAASADVPRGDDDPATTVEAGDETEGFADWLPNTGSEIPVILMWMAGFAIAVGAALVVAGRREREHEDV